MFSNDGEIPEELAQNKAVVDPTLANGLDFDAYDLASNRDSLLSDRQKRGLEDFKIRKLRDVISATVLYVLIFLVFTLIFISGMNPNNKDSLGDWMLIIGIIALILTVIGVIGIVSAQSSAKATHINHDINEGIVLSETGIVILDTNKKIRTGTPYMLTINDQVFNPPHEAFLRFKHLDRYTIYYAPHSKIILSAEPA